jgi:hypothetical protein
MNRVSVAATLLAGVLVSARPMSAQVANGASREKLVVTASWLAEHLNDRDLVVLQVGRRPTYEAGHIPGARFVDYDAGALAAPMDHSGASPDHVMLEMPYVSVPALWRLTVHGCVKLGDPRIADSSSRKAVNFSSARTTKRFPWLRCASAMQIVRLLESIAETQPPTSTGFAEIIGNDFPVLHAPDSASFCFSSRPAS